MAGRPRKPSAVKDLEGNRGRRDIPAELQLEGRPDLGMKLGRDATDHFNFLAAEFGETVLKRADTPALMMLAALWEKFWAAVDDDDDDKMCKFKQRWDSAASKLGLSPIDRSRLVTAGKENPDELEDRYFRVTG